MRSQKALTTTLRRLARLLDEEAARNPEFAGRLSAVLSTGETTRPRSRKSASPPVSGPTPDLHAEFRTRGYVDFRLWLRQQPVTVVRAFVREHDLDPTRRTAKWKDPEKLGTFVADQLRSRLARGSSFLRTGG